MTLNCPRCFNSGEVTHIVYVGSGVSMVTILYGTPCDCPYANSTTLP